MKYGVRSKPPPNHQIFFLPTFASKNLIFICAHDVFGLLGWIITETPVALNFLSPFRPFLFNALTGRLLPMMLEKLTAAFSIYFFPDIAHVIPPPPDLCFQIVLSTTDDLSKDLIEPTIIF